MVQGNGCTDLVYVYQCIDGGRERLCLVQLAFDWNEKRFTVSRNDDTAVVAGPMIALDKAQLIVGDLDGDG